MASRLPPIPPAARTRQGPAESQPAEDAAVAQAQDQAVDNLAEQGRQGNIWQNTRNQG